MAGCFEKTTMGLLILVMVLVDTAVTDCPSSSPLGMESRAIPDDHITASSEKTGYEAWRGRLNNGVAWETNTVDTDQWLQIDLGSQKIITGVQTQGLWGGHTKSYKLLYSDDGTSWETYGDGQNDTIFDGNTDGPTIVNQTLPSPVTAQYIRINPQTWEGSDFIRLRVELLGCAAVITTAVPSSVPTSVTEQTTQFTATPETPTTSSTTRQVTTSMPSDQSTSSPHVTSKEPTGGMSVTMETETGAVTTPDDDIVMSTGGHSTELPYTEATDGIITTIVMETTTVAQDQMTNTQATVEAGQTTVAQTTDEVNTYTDQTTVEQVTHEVSTEETTVEHTTEEESIHTEQTTVEHTTEEVSIYTEQATLEHTTDEASVYTEQTTLEKTTDEVSITTVVMETSSMMQTTGEVTSQHMSTAPVETTSPTAHSSTAGASTSPDDVTSQHSSMPPVITSSPAIYHSSTDDVTTQHSSTSSAMTSASTDRQSTDLTSTIRDSTTTDRTLTSPAATASSTVHPSTTGITETLLYYEMTLVSMTFTDDLNDPESTAYQDLAAQVISLVTSYLETDVDVGSAVTSVTILGFRSGSVIVDYVIRTAASSDVTSSQVQDVLVSAAEADTNNTLGVDISSLCQKDDAAGSCNTPPDDVIITYAIIGGAAGATVLILSVFVILLCCLRANSRKDEITLNSDLQLNLMETQGAEKTLPDDHVYDNSVVVTENVYDNIKAPSNGYSAADSS
ncbi:hypothetical protein Bbelb_126140 [Branchiostoma belcheri]|nr:hypothetical protein Bbelb_126140 [Branchiostoma belcheri]